MRNIICFLFILLIFNSAALPNETKPFSELLNLVGKKGSWTFNRKENAHALYKERIRLGDKFKYEVIKFINENIDRHYNIAMFLSDQYYLGNEKPMNELALLIYHQGLSIIKKSNNEMDKANEIAFRVFASILSYRMNLISLAIHHKSITQKLLKTNKFPGTFPAIDKKERQIYKMIPVMKLY